jgi:hypothetical protein
MTRERLAELVAKFEVATTDGEISLTGDDIGEVYEWLSFIQLDYPPLFPQENKG